VAPHQPRPQASGVAHPQRSGRSAMSRGGDCASDAEQTDRPVRREPRCAADRRVRAESQPQTSARQSALMLQPCKGAAGNAHRTWPRTRDVHGLGFNSHSPRALLTENRIWRNWAILGQNAIPGQGPAVSQIATRLPGPPGRRATSGPHHGATERDIVHQRPPKELRGVV